MCVPSVVYVLTTCRNVLIILMVVYVCCLVELCLECLTSMLRLYNHGAECGQCYEVVGPKGNVTVCATGRTYQEEKEKGRERRGTGERWDES